MKNQPTKPTRDPDQVRRIIDVALQVAADGKTARIDVVTRLRAAICLAEEAGLTIWVDELTKMVETLP